MRPVLLALVVVLAACVHNPEKYVEPYGKGVYRCDDGACPHFANQYCSARHKVMQPLQQGGKDGLEAWQDSNVLLFKCVDDADSQEPTAAALPPKR
jgi:hypothetical protein